MENLKEKKSVQPDKPKKKYNYTKKTGNPGKYKSINLETVKFLITKGLREEDVAHVLNLNRNTLTSWKRIEEFASVLKEAKDIYDNQVERALFERATGYWHYEEVLHHYQGKIIKTEVKKYYPPDPVSMIFWLKNRRRDEWRDKHDFDVKGGINTVIYNINKPDSFLNDKEREIIKVKPMQKVENLKENAD